MNYELFWMNYFFSNNIDSRITPVEFNKPAFTFRIKEIPFIIYESSVIKSDIELSLICTHELLFPIYEIFFIRYHELYQYIYEKNQKRMKISRIGALADSCSQLNELVNNSYEKVKQLYKSIINKSINSSFDDIYLDSTWGYGSGSGSDALILKKYVDYLNTFITDKGISTIVDCGCGDWQYMRYVDLSNCNYIGFDVSSIIIALDNLNFASSNIHFSLYSGNFKCLPGADMLICKEVLQHLSNNYIHNFISILGRYKYALIGGHSLLIA